MIKVYVILVGLIGVIPAPDGKSVTAILLKTDGHKTAMGVAITPHEPKVIFRSPSGLVKRPLAGDLTFTPAEAQKDYEMNLRDHERFPKLGELLHRPIVVNPGCTGGNPAMDCRLNNLPLSAARVRLVGGWVLRPIEVEGGDPCCDELQRRPQARDGSLWGFRPANDKEREHGREGEFTNGFMFEIWLPKLASLHIAGGGELTIEKHLPGDCIALDPSAPDCAVITVSNIGQCEHMHDCRTRRLHDDSDDTHFELLYALLAPFPTADHRFIPFRKTKHLSRPSELSGPGQPPGSKCFGGFVQ